MKLIGSLTSPYVRKVRIVMAEKKLDYQFVEEDVWGSDAILASNPLGKVPCLVMEGGEAVFDSRVIVEYLDARSPLARLIPEPNRERTEVRTWEALADGIVDAADPGAPRGDLGRPHRRAALQAWIDRQMKKVDASLEADRHRPGGQAVVHRHPHDAGRHRGRLRARLPRLPLPADRLARRAPEPGAPGRQAERAPELHRHGAAARLITPRRSSAAGRSGAAARRRAGDTSRVAGTGVALKLLALAIGQ